MDAIAKVKGTNGIIYVYHDKVLISRRTLCGYFSQGNAGGRTYFFTDISGVEFKKPSFWANGYLKIIVTGTNDVNSSVNRFGMTTKKSRQDANTLTVRAFKKETPIQAQLVYDTIMAKLTEVKTDISKRINSIDSKSNIDQLQKLANLHKSGMLTEEEFDKEKKKLLNT